MKTCILSAACLALIFGLAVSVSAQADPVQAKIPFSFTVFGKTLSAGDYWISAAPHIIKIQDANLRVVAMASANEISNRAPGEKGHLLFHCYQERCFLAEIWLGEYGNGRQLFTSKAETILAKEEKGKYFAVLWENAAGPK
jgi:hypothetical protein